MGASVQTNSSFPEWAAVTRPYATIPFVLAVQDPSWSSWADIPHDRKIGTALQSLGELVYITWAQQQPEAERWKRLPYADTALMLKRVLDGSLGGMLLWQPALRKLQNEQTDAPLRVIDLAPVPETAIKVGAVVSSRDTFLRNQIDQTIDALVADGTIQALLDKHGYTGHQGD
jgi:polar amino acid transport system substrate-binding protein